MNKLRNVIGLIGAVLLMCCVSSCILNPEYFSPEITSVEKTDNGFKVSWLLEGEDARALMYKKGLYVVVYYSQDGFIDSNGDFDKNLKPNTYEEVIALSPNQKIEWTGESLSVNLPVTKRGEYFIWISAENKKRTVQKYGTYVARKEF